MTRRGEVSHYLLPDGYGVACGNPCNDFTKPDRASPYLQHVDCARCLDRAEDLIRAGLPAEDLTRRIGDLRAFEAEYRARLRAYHQQRIDELDGPAPAREPGKDEL